jgi:hypothetical protein
MAKPKFAATAASAPTADHNHCRTKCQAIVEASIQLHCLYTNKVRARRNLSYFISPHVLRHLLQQQRL